jgi:hypothetical protein
MTNTGQIMGGTVMGDLLKEIQETEIHPGNRSRIAEILEALEPSDRKDLLAALDDHAISASRISKAMARRGHKLASSVISRYRRGELSTKIK